MKTKLWLALFGLTVLLICAFALEGQKKKVPEPISHRPIRDVRVTYGPVVILVQQSVATVSWSTNVSTDTVLRYGTGDNHLDQTASTPWGGTNHLVQLTNLAPDTTYYYRVGKPAGQETEPMSLPAQFETLSVNSTP